jgi:Tfp pilus assembly protein FimT
MAMKTVNNATLRSLFAVVMIVGIESVVALPRISNAIKDYRLNSAATEVWQDMHRARIMAIKEKKTIQVDFDDNSYRIVRAATGEVVLSRHLSREYPEISIVVTESSGGIAFDRTGAAEGGSKEIEISGPTGKRKFTILATGLIGGLP